MVNVIISPWGFGSTFAQNVIDIIYSNSIGKSISAWKCSRINSASDNRRCVWCIPWFSSNSWRAIIDPRASRTSELRCPATRQTSIWISTRPIQRTVQSDQVGNAQHSQRRRCNTGRPASVDYDRDAASQHSHYGLLRGDCIDCDVE